MLQKAKRALTFSKEDALKEAEGSSDEAPQPEATGQPSQALPKIDWDVLSDGDLDNLMAQITLRKQVLSEMSTLAKPAQTDTDGPMQSVGKRKNKAPRRLQPNSNVQ